MLTRACLGALRCTPACMSGIGLAKHSGFVIGSYPHSLFYFRRRFSGLRATCKLPASSSGSHTPLLLRTCSASASTATVRDATRTEQNNVTKFVHSLSEEQAAAALAGDGHLRIIAGPGSGKTRVLTSRVEYLIKEKGCKPWEMVVITFSNKAARELQDRLAVLLGTELASQVIAGTFHSVGCQIVRRNVAKLGDTGRQPFAIFDQDDTKNVMKLALKKHFSLRRGIAVAAAPIDEGAEEPVEEADVASAEQTQLQDWEQGKGLEKLAKRFRHDISLIKNGVSTCFGLNGRAAIAKYKAGSAALVNSLDKEHELAEEAGVSLDQAFDLYEAELKQNRGLDFDDLLSWPVALLEQCPEVRSRLQKRYKHILVDEFQDTNAPQYEMVRLLAGSKANVFVVGDPDQAIYGWRGANVINMQQSFNTDYPGAQTLQLRDNYRSTPQVLRGAEGVLKNLLSTGATPERVVLNPLLDGGPQIQVTQVSNERTEAETVVSIMQQLHRQGRHRWKDMAILYRTNAQSRLFEEQLVRKNVPYQVIGGTPFWTRKEVKDLMAYIKLAINPEDDLSLMRAINQPTRGVGAESQLKLKAWAEGQGLSLGQALFPNFQATTAVYAASMGEPTNSTSGLLGWPDATPWPSTCDLTVKDLGLSKKAAGGVSAFCKTILVLRALLQHHRLAPVLEMLLQHISFEEFVLAGRSGKDKQQNRWQNVQQVLGAAEHHAEQPPVRGLDYLETSEPAQEGKQGLAGVQDFLEQVALWSEPEKAAAEEEQEGAPDVVNVMTLHLSKGLEFAVVFIVGCEDALMPHGGLQRDMSDPRDLERHNEEVRLLYVGMTRAKQQLYLMHAQERALRGGMQRSSASISPFLKSIPGCAPCRSNSTSLSNHKMRQQTPGAMYYHRPVHGTSENSQTQPPTRQIMTASRAEGATVSAPATPAQRRAARRQR
ncbi:hypothetical protein ABBQ38_002158 [Trebouxia sp. C0009 RCD-2024]